MPLSPLDKKLFRDLVRMWAQALAIALVMAGGVATLILAVGAYRSLLETRATYYERHAFADLFATLTRAPEHVGERIARVPGVATSETRIVRRAIVNVEPPREPVSGLLQSLPDHGTQQLNRLYLRSGRLPGPRSRREVVVSQAFADAYRLAPGAMLKAQINDRLVSLEIVGTALSPEFIYAMAPGELVPDPRRFAVIWMAKTALRGLFDMDGAFNAVAVKLLRGASAEEVLRRLDTILAPYGGRGAYERRDQMSHAFLDAELKQIATFARTLPPIFLLVSAFLINMTLARLIDLEREQIGLLKALGYRSITIAAHYLKLALLIATVGIIIGSAAGTWLGRGLTRIYGTFYQFPFLVFTGSFDLYATAALVTLAAAALGAARSVARATALAPAVAMSPPAPTPYRRLLGGAVGRLSALPQWLVMVLRHMLRWPVRAAVSILGVALAVAVLVASLFGLDSVDFVVDMTFFRSERQDVTVAFAEARPRRALHEVAHLPGVLRAEPFRTVDAKISHRHRERRIAIIGRSPDADLSRVLDLDLAPVAIPDSGITLTEKLAELLDVTTGSTVRVRLMEGHRRAVDVPVVAIIQSYLGLAAHMDLASLNRMMTEDATISGAYLLLDPRRKDRFFAAVRRTPGIEGIAMHNSVLAKFRETMAENIGIMITVYTGLGLLIAFGVVYNSARIQLSERTREFASLRVLGFTRAEVFRVLIVELALLVALAVPLGWGLGLLMAYGVVQGFDNEIFRVPFIVGRDTLVWAALVVVAAAIVSALVVRRRVARLDLIAALKARE